MSPGALRDPQQRYVRHSMLLLFALSILATTTAAILHAFEPNATIVNRVVPALMAVTLSVVMLRYWLEPSSLQSSVWLGWSIAVAGLAAPAWGALWTALTSTQRLIEILPPITAGLLPLLLVPVVIARPRHAWWATACAWLAIAAPVLFYLASHPEQLWTPRGLDLAIAFGPISMFVPFLIPLLRGIERRIEVLQEDGERLQALADRDALLGIYNRRAGERFLATLLANRPTAHTGILVLFDIDHFKSINDRFGHPAGDHVLVECARRCALLLDSEDVLARWGGEEFLVISPTGQRSGALIAERLCTALRASPIHPVGIVTASFGVTCLGPNDTPGQALQRADNALYQAKAGGRDRVVVAPVD